MSNETIGTHAGVVWRTLYGSEKEMSLEALVRTTGLRLIEVVAAIGWLARENKIMIKEDQDEYCFAVYKECYY